MKMKFQMALPMKINIYLIAILFIFLAQHAQAKEVFTPKNFNEETLIVDANVLSDKEKTDIKTWLNTAITEKHIRIIVWVVTSSEETIPSSVSVEDFASKTLTQNAQNDSDLLLFFACKERIVYLAKQHKTPEEKLTSQEFVQEIAVPIMEEKNHSLAITETLHAVLIKYANTRIRMHLGIKIILLLLPVFALAALSLGLHGKRGWGWILVGLVIVVVLSAIYLIRQLFDAKSALLSSSTYDNMLNELLGGGSGGTWR